MGQTISMRINLNQIEKGRLYNGTKGTYLDAVIFLKDEVDQYGNSGMVVQSITAEQKASGERGSILGNVKILGSKQVNKEKPFLSQSKPENIEDLPF